MSCSKVLLLGDSIRMSYQQQVAAKLQGRAQVVGPAVNCQFALFTLSSIGNWIGQLGKPDIVHWNNGIHDAGYNPRRSPVQIPLEDYVANLSHIVNHIRNNLTDKLIFATSTPPHPDKPFDEQSWLWKPGDIERYNDAAVALMNEQGVKVNDLYSVVAADLDAMLCEDQLHLSEQGVEACADRVAAVVSEML